MKKNTIITSSLVSCLLLSASLAAAPLSVLAVDNEQATAASTEVVKENDVQTEEPGVAGEAASPATMVKSLASDSKKFTLQKEFPIAVGADDAEVNPTAVNLVSTGLDLHGPTTYDTYLRFRNISLPNDANIKNVYLVFTARNSSTKPTSLKISGEVGASNEFTSQASTFANRQMSASSVEARTSDKISADDAFTTPSVLPIISELKEKNGSLDNVVFKIEGNRQGSYIARSFESNAKLAPKLVFEYESEYSESVSTIAASKDVAEEYGTAQTIIQSGNLEIGGYFANTLTQTYKQITGLRFNGIQIPENAEIEDAYIEFVTASTTSNGAVANMEIRSEVGVSEPYKVVNKNLSARNYSQLAVKYQQPAFTATRQTIRTPNLSNLINESRINGWTADQPLVFMLDGDNFIGSVYSTGTNTVPKLTIRYKSSDTPIVFDDVITNPQDIKNVFVNEVGAEGSAESKEDWVELYNGNDQPVLLDKGIFITSKKKQAELSNIIIPAKGYRVLTMDKKPELGNDHISFDLGGEADVKLLANVSGTSRVINSIDYVKQKYNQTYGRKPDGSTNTALLNKTTYSSTNNQAPTDATLTFSKERGVYPTGFMLELKAVDNMKIIYTIDGSEPTVAKGKLYTGPINIQSSTVVKAYAFDDNQTSNLVAHTYVLENNYANEVKSGEQWRYKDTITSEEYAEGMKDFPVVSITSSLVNLTTTDAPGTFEYIDAHTVTGHGNFFNLSLNKKFGQVSASQYNAGVAAKFNRNVNTTKSNYQFFEAYPNDAFPVVKKFAKLELKEGQDGPQNDIYGLGYNRYDEKVTNTLAKDMKKIALNARYAHYFYNGKYMGLKTLREDFGTKMFEEYFGGNDDDYTKVRFQDGYFPTGTVEAGDGDPAAWTTIKKSVTAKDLQEAKKYIDMEDLIKTQILFMFVDTEREIDGVIENSAMTGDASATKMKFNINDTDGAFYNRNLTGTGQAALDGGGGTYRYKWNTDSISRTGAAGIFGTFSGDSTTATAGNLEFKTLVKDQVLQQIGPASGNFKGTEGAPLSVGNVQKVISDNQKEVNDAYKLDAAFMGARKTMYTEWLAQQPKIQAQVEDRVKFSLEMWLKYNMAHTLQPVQVNGAAGSLTLTNPNADTVVYYTVDGTDPMGANGTVSSSAIQYIAGSTINAQTSITVRAFQQNNWGPLSSSAK